MDLKEKLVSSFMAFEEQIDVHSTLHDTRTAAIKNFENKGFPTKKEEAWKYTSLNSILNNDYSVFPKNENSIEFADVKKYFLHEIDTYKVILPLSQMKERTFTFQKARLLKNLLRSFTSQQVLKPL
jgi:Fe-S cluster assembly protein SufD